MSTTTITITDPKLLEQIVLAQGHIVFIGPGGEHLKTATVDAGRSPKKGPMSAEEFEEARKSPNSGITLAEFWEKVKRGEWK